MREAKLELLVRDALALLEEESFRVRHPDDADARAQYLRTQTAKLRDRLSELQKTIATKEPYEFPRIEYLPHQ